MVVSHCLNFFQRYNKGPTKNKLIFLHVYVYTLTIMCMYIYICMMIEKLLISYHIISFKNLKTVVMIQLLLLLILLCFFSAPAASLASWPSPDQKCWDQTGSTNETNETWNDIMKTWCLMNMFISISWYTILMLPNEIYVYVTPWTSLIYKRIIYHKPNSMFMELVCLCSS